MTTRSASFRGLAGATAVVASTLIPSVEQAGASEPVLQDNSLPPQDEPQQITSLPQDYTSQPATYAEESDLEKSLGELRALFGTRYGGQYVDWEANAVSVAVVDLTPEEATRVEASSTGRLQFSGSQAAIGEQALHDLGWSLRRDLDGRISEDLATVTISSDSRIEILIADDVEAGAATDAAVDSVLANASSALPLGSLAKDISLRDLIAVIPGKATDVSDQRNNGPVRGGRWVDSSMACTAGWFMRNSNGTRRYTTAGHCGGHNGAVHMGNGVTFLGFIVNDQPNNLDVLAHEVPFNYDDHSAVTIAANGSFRNVVNVEGAGFQHFGDDYCYAGRGTYLAYGDNERCGDFNKTVLKSSGYYYNCIERRGTFGDSGAPVYDLDGNGRVIAVGSVTQTLEEAYTFHSDHWVCHARIDDVTRAFDYVLQFTK